MTNERDPAKCVHHEISRTDAGEWECNWCARKFAPVSPQPEPSGELAEEVDGRDCEIAFNAVQHYVGSETAHLTPAEQYTVFKRVARSLERDCDEMVREAVAAVNRTPPHDT